MRAGGLTTVCGREVNCVWRDDFGNANAPVTGTIVKYDTKTLIAMDRIIHIGSGTGTFGVKTGPTRWEDDDLEGEGRQRRLTGLFTRAWRLLCGAVAGLGQMAGKLRLKNVA